MTVFARAWGRLVVLLIVAMCGATHGWAQVAARVRTQLNADAAQGFAYRKHAAVSDDPSANPNWEHRQFRVSRGRMRPAAGADTSTSAFADELTDALQYSYDDPRLIDQFTVLRRGDTLVATRRADARTPLIEQRVLRTPEGRVAFVASRIEITSTLYTSRRQAELYFDAQGRYQRHSLELVTQLRLIGTPRVVRVRGERE